MRFVALLVVVLIIYMLYLGPGRKESMQNRLQEAQQEAEALEQANPKDTPTPHSTTPSIKVPLDRTKKALEQVQERNSGGEF